MAKLFLNKPNRPQGESMRVANLGVFENGGEYEVEQLGEDLHIPPRPEDLETEDDQGPVDVSMEALSAQETGTDTEADSTAEEETR